MLPRSLTSVIIPRALLLTGLACGVVLASRTLIQDHRARETFAAEEQDYARREMVFDHCAAEIKKSGGYGGVLDMVIEARCPVKPSVMVWTRPASCAWVSRLERRILRL